MHSSVQHYGATEYAIGFSCHRLVVTSFMGGSSGELHDLAHKLVDRARACGMEVSTGKSKIVANSTNQHRSRRY